MLYRLALNYKQMKKALITGANKGIGLETARQLLQQGFYVYPGSRNLMKDIKQVQSNVIF